MKICSVREHEFSSVIIAEEVSSFVSQSKAEACKHPGYLLGELNMIISVKLIAYCALIGCIWHELMSKLFCCYFD